MASSALNSKRSLPVGSLKYLCSVASKGKSLLAKFLSPVLRRLGGEKDSNGEQQQTISLMVKSLSEPMNQGSLEV
jgi:hypothetical protein